MKYCFEVMSGKVSVAAEPGEEITVEAAWDLDEVEKFISERGGF